MELYDATYIIYFLRTIFNAILVGILFGFFIYLFDKSRTKEAGSQRQIYYSYAFFCVMYSLTRLFFIFSDFIVFHYNTSNNPLNDLFVGLAYVVVISGVLLLQIMVERHLLHTRYIFSIINSVVLFLAVLSAIQIIPTEIPRYVVVVAAPAFIVIVGLLYLYIVIKSAGEVRRRAIGILVGLSVVGVGILLESSLLGNVLDLIPNFFTLRILISPFIITIGFAIFSISQR